MSALDDLLSGGVKARDALTQLLAPAIDWYNAQPSWLERAAAASASNDPTTMRPSPQQLALGEDTAGGFVGAIKAYHGSPYDFAKFDTSKIGTGEGAQAYGHGLYFAENPAVAADYRKALSDMVYSSNKNPTSMESVADKYIRNYAGIDNAIKGIDSELAKYAKGSTSEAYLTMLKDVVKSRIPGRMYEVNINAEPEHFLDYDRPLSEQPPQVQPLLREAIQKEAYNRALASTSKARADELWSYVKDPMKAPAGFAQDLLKKPEVVAQLREAGIPGIKYLDQGSRTTSAGELIDVFKGPEGWQSKIRMNRPNGEQYFTTSAPHPTQEAATKWANDKIANPGTSNYVVFDDKLIDIVKKYGVAGLMLSGAGGAALGEKPR